MKLKQKRKSLNISINELAFSTKIDRRSIQRHEAGEIIPSLRTLKKYMKVFNCDISEIAKLKTCKACNEELPETVFFTRGQTSDLCVDCRKTETATKGRDRPFTEAEGMTYIMGLARGQGVREIAREHNRSAGFVKEVLYGKRENESV